MFNYTICDAPDREVFRQQCLALEKHIPGIIRRDFLHDVDDSYTQVYEKDGAKILVHNSYYEGELYVESEIELTQFFKR